jgi:hypothetical protein
MVSKRSRKVKETCVVWPLLLDPAETDVVVVLRHETYSLCLTH